MTLGAIFERLFDAIQPNLANGYQQQQLRKTPSAAPSKTIFEQIRQLQQ
jgi:hypothetical protein